MPGQLSVTVPAAQGPWSLVGRASEMAQVAAARADTACPGAVIIAPAGIWKSRVAREACVAAQADGAVTLWAQATVCSAVIPLGALAAAPCQFERVVGADLAWGQPAFTLGSLAMERGRYRDAERWLVEAEARLEHHDTFATASCIRGLQVGIAYFTGDSAGARAALDSLRAQIAGRD